MQEYDSSQSAASSLQQHSFESKPFQYDYFLSKSQDVFSSWNQSAIIYEFQKKQQRNLKYLREEFRFVKSIQKYRTAYIIRTNGFIHILKMSFKELQQKLAAVFLGEKKEGMVQERVVGEEGYKVKLKTVRALEQQLMELLKYLQVILDQGMHLFDENFQNFQQSIFEIISSLYRYIINPKILWDILGAEIQLIQVTFPHAVSIGGNHSYYQNILHNLLKRSLKLRQVYEQISNKMPEQIIQNWQSSTFLLKIIIQIQQKNINDISERQKYDFLDCIKGMYFLSINLRMEDTYFEYMFMSFHIEHLQSHKIYKNYEEIESVFIKVLDQARKNYKLMSFVETLELNLLPFQKRTRVPEIENITIDIVNNYIGAAKYILKEETLFPEVKMIEESQIYASSEYMLYHESVNGLVDLLMRIQEYSKSAFSLGGLEVHKIYLKMSELLKKIYLSYEHSNWIFPPDILLYIPLGHFIQISDDIKAEVKKTLFTLVNNLNQDHLPCKITVEHGKLKKIKVSQGEYLQIILYFLEAVKEQEQFINLPEILPRNRETAILYIKSLESKLSNKEPTPDQKNYIIENLRFCEQQKLTIKFTWYENKELVHDRIKQFNIQKQLLLEWMRNLYRETINKRQNQKIQIYFEKYSQKKLKLLKIAELLKYNHGINNIINLNQKNIKEEDLFELLEEIRFLFLINFDIFDQSLDEEISLNYLHVCIAIYNSRIKEAPGNQIYEFILEKIMVPYIRFPNSSKTKFKNKYPGFFQKWIYSFQIGRLFEVLGVYIQQRGTDESCLQDIVSKIIIIRQFLDNQSNILQANMNLEQLTITIVSFSTIVTPFINPQVYLEAVELYCLFLNKFPMVKQETSLEFVLSCDVLSDKNIIDEALKYVKAEIYAVSVGHEVSILNHLVLKLPNYIKNIGLVKAFDIIKTYFQLKKIDKADANMSAFYEEMIRSDPHQGNFHEILLSFILIIKKIWTKWQKIFEIPEARFHNQNEEISIKQSQKQLKQLYEQNLPKMIKIKQKLISLTIEHINLQNIHLTDLMFIQNILELVGVDFSQHPLIQKQQNLLQIIALSKDIIIDLLNKIGTNDDFMFFAQKLDLPVLIMCGGQREEQLLIDMIVENKHKEIQTELIKKLLRQNRKLSDAATKAIKILSKHKEKIHSYHINRFIHINSRYPHPQIEAFLIENMVCQRNNTFAKINQQYLINDLRSKLQQVPKRLCEELLLKPMKIAEKDKLVQLISQIYEKSLYLPITKFDKIDMKVIEENYEDEDWNTQSQNEEIVEIKQIKQKKSKDKHAERQEQENSSVEDHPVEEEINSDDSDSDGEDNQYGDDDRPSFLEIFTDEARKHELEMYNKLMAVREELDVLIDGDYNNLQEGNQVLANSEVIDKILAIGSILNQISVDFKQLIAVKMPEELLNMCINYNLQIEIDQELKTKLQKQRQACKRTPKWITEYFSDRSQSDDSQIQDDQDQNEEGEQESYHNGNYYQGDGDEYVEQDDDQDDQDDDLDEIDRQHLQIRRLKRIKNEIKINSAKKNKKKGKQLELPLLIPSYSKIEQEITGKELKYEEITKILQIALYMLLHLPETQIRTKQITSFYLEIFQSNFGQMFLQSFFTVIRFDQTNKNLESYIKEQEVYYKGKVQVGLQEISMEDSINNVLYLLKEYNQKMNKNNKGNVLFLESGILLPIAVEMMNKFNLPIQNNCLTLLLIFITTNKGKIRKKIEQLNYNINEQLQNNQKEYHVKKIELIRIIDMICKYKSSCHIWELIQEQMGLKIKREVKLMECISGYGRHLLKKVTETGRRIYMTIQQISSIQKDMDQQDYLHTIQNSHHIISKLLFGCKEEIKQFYFINKKILRESFEDEDIDQQGTEEYLAKIPKLFNKLKKKIMNSRELIMLSESMCYFLNLIKNEFYGKIEDKMFNKLIHYPKMLIESIWYYIFMFAKTEKYMWTTPQQVEAFFQTYPMLGSYNFNNLQEVFNLILNFLSLESFCTDKFKQLFMPILMKNPLLAQQIHLRFKMPTINEDDYSTSILVTRRCSFDMAYYQNIGSGIQVQFHEEEGSDHGGLVRELMIGWKGRGVGEQAFFIGKILGISFKQGVPYGGALDIGIFVAITNFVPSIKFFEEVDPQIYKSLIYIRDNDPTALSISFSVQKIINGKIIQFQLIQAGKNIFLTQSNKEKYINAYTASYFYLGRQKELKEIKKGFDSVVFPLYAQIFTPSEMLRQIRGEEVVDVKMLISKAKYQGYSQQSQIIKWFWQIVQGFPQERMNTFIQFVTGSPKITVFNNNFSITIEKAYDINCLPVAHTCFNTLDLPEYSSREILERKLLMAISEGNNSFGIL